MKATTVKLQAKDPSASKIAVKIYDETGKQEIVKRGSGSVPKNILITIDGKTLTSNQPPVNVQGNVMVPMRAIFEAFGTDLNWNQSTQTILATKGSKEVKLQINSKKAYIDGEEVTLSTPPQLINNSTMVPVRFVSEALGADVFWDSDAQTVVITR